LNGVPCVNGTFIDAVIPLGQVLTFLVYRPAQRGVQDWKARISIRSFTSPESDALVPLPSHIQSAIPSPSRPDHSSPSLTPHLCYACHTTLTSRSSRGTKNSLPTHTNAVAPLPVWVNSRLLDSTANPGNEIRDGLGGEDVAGEVWQGKKMDVSEMRDVVQDFLLED